LLMVILLTNPLVFAGDTGGSADLNYTATRQLEEGTKTSEKDSFSQDYNLGMDSRINPLISYRLSLRARFSDSTTESDGSTAKSFYRIVDPGMDVFFENPLFDFEGGYRRREQWTHSAGEGRRTTEDYYSRLGIVTYYFPTLSLQFNRRKNETDTGYTTATGYSVSSAYILPSEDVRLSLHGSYTRNINEAPHANIHKSINDTFSSGYNIGYAGSLWNGRASYSVSYKGSFNWNKTRQYVTEEGTVLTRRTALAGLYAQGSPGNEDVGELSLKSSLVNEELVSATSIDLSTAEFHNIGIHVSPAGPVDRIFIYVNADVSADSNLNTTTSWRLLRSDFNQTGTWTEKPIKSVTVTSYDTPNNIYRYEIEFSAPQSASYFKVINLKTSGVSGVSVTEIEAYGTDSTDSLTTESEYFSQGLNFSASARPLDKLLFSVTYSITRTDQNPDSAPASVGGMFSNIFDKSVSGEKEDFSCNIQRSYSAGATWMAHRLLTTSLGVQRTETFNDTGTTDMDYNTYSLSFSSSPAPTVDANLSLIRSDRFDSGERSSTDNTVLLSVGSRLYRYVTMITDAGYTLTDSFASDTQSSSRFINGSLDVDFTRRMTGTFRYGFFSSRADGSSSDSKKGAAVITYRPARLVNLSGRFEVSDSDGDTVTTEGVTVNLYPLPVIQVNMDYRHDNFSGSGTRDRLGGSLTWVVTKFIRARINYNYARDMREEKAENHTMNANLNMRF